MSEIFTTLLSVFIGFLLGILGQFVSSKTKEHKDKKEFKRFNKMITKEYVEPYHSLSDLYFNAGDSSTKDDLINTLAESVRKLGYLKEEELRFLKSDNQFRMIRLIEFTKIYFNQSLEVFKKYSFQDPTANREDYDKEKEVHRENVNELRKKYSEQKEKYLNLEVDSI